MNISLFSFFARSEKMYNDAIKTIILQQNKSYFQKIIKFLKYVFLV